MIDKSTKIKTGEKGDCTVLRPSLMCAVPLVIDRIYKGINENVSKQGPFMEKLLSFCYQYKSYYRQKGMQTPIMDALIFRKMRSLVSSYKIILIIVILSRQISFISYDKLCFYLCDYDLGRRAHTTTSFRRW